MKFSRTISRVKWLNSENTNVSPLNHLTPLTARKNFITLSRRILQSDEMLKQRLNTVSFLLITVLYEAFVKYVEKHFIQTVATH
jgi:hypothetical protein